MVCAALGKLANTEGAEMIVRNSLGVNGLSTASAARNKEESNGFAKIYEEARIERSASNPNVPIAANSLAPGTLKPSDPDYFSISTTTRPGSEAPGLNEALNGIVNDPGSKLTRGEKTQLTFFTYIAEADAESASPRFSTQFPGFKGVGTSGFNAENALMSVVDFLGKDDPNILAAGQQWQTGLHVKGSA